MHGPLKFKVLIVAKLLRDLSPNFLNFNGKYKSLKLAFTLNCVLKRTKDLKTISNFRFAFDLLQKFEAVPYKTKSFPNLSAQNRNIINILLTSFSWSVL